MSSRQPTDAGLPASFIARVIDELRADGAARHQLPGGGRIAIDRPLPFLALYRRPRQRKDLGTRRLVMSEAAFLIASTDPAEQRGLRELVKAIAEQAIDRFGAFLLLELWSAAGGAVTDEATAVSPAPGFRVFTFYKRGLVETLGALTGQLGRVRILNHAAEVELIQGQKWGHAGFSPLLTRQYKRLPGLRAIGLEVQPFFRNGDGEVYPIVLRRLRRQLSLAFKRTFHRFATKRASEAPVSYHALGQRTVPKSVLKIDGQLTDIATSFDFVLEVTPVNVDAAWSRFRRQRFAREPEFFYRPLSIDPAAHKRRLFAISTEHIEEPTLAVLFREKQLGIDRELSALLDRGSSRFIQHGQLLFGGVSEELLSIATQLLSRLPPRDQEARGKGFVDAQGLAELARAEVEHYRSQHAAFGTRVEVRDDLYSGLMVSRGNLLIGRNARFPANRVEALLQHEIGTHALTYHAGRAQPLQLLSSGLPGYDEFQEGIAVIAEYLVGGLSRARLRLLAGRVVAARAMLEGSTFLETFRLLHREHGFDQKTAFTIGARIHRGGGLSKDAIYLRGLLKVLRYLARGGSFETLLIGKIAASQVRMMNELLLRKVLKPAPVHARYLDDPAAQRRLAALRSGGDVFQLMRGGV